MHPSEARATADRMCQRRKWGLEREQHPHARSNWIRTSAVRAWVRRATTTIVPEKRYMAFWLCPLSVGGSGPRRGLACWLSPRCRIDDRSQSPRSSDTERRHLTITNARKPVAPPRCPTDIRNSLPRDALSITNRARSRGRVCHHHFLVTPSQVPERPTMGPLTIVMSCDFLGRRGIGQAALHHETVMLLRV